MNVTDYQLMDAVLSELQDVSEMAVLHREEDIAAHRLDSDADLCVSDHPLEVMSGIASRLADSGIFLILTSNYDRSSYNFFFSDSGGQSGAQIDLLQDPKGIGYYGVRTSALLAKRRAGVRWPRIDELDEALYVLRKRQVKRDFPRILEMRSALQGLGTERAVSRSGEILNSRANAAVVRLLVDDRLRVPRTTGLWFSRVMRPARLVRRCGFWAHVVGDSAGTEAAELSRRLDGVLVKAEAVADPGLSCLLSHLWRPYLLISTGKRPAWLRPDVILETGAESDETDVLATQLVVSMHRRALRQLAPGPKVAQA